MGLHGRGPPGCDGGVLLRDKGGLCSEGGQGGGGALGSTSVGEVDGHDQRGATQGTWDRPPLHFQAARLPRSLRSARDREPVPPWRERKESHPWRRGVGSMDGEPRRRGKRSRRRRAGSFKEERARGGREREERGTSRQGRECEFGKRESLLPEEEEKEEEEKQEVPEPEEGSREGSGISWRKGKEGCQGYLKGGKEAGWSSSHPSQPKGSSGPILRHWVGSGGSAPEKGPEKGSTLPEQEGFQEGFIEFVVDKFKKQPIRGGRSGRREPVCRDGKGPFGSSDVSGCTGLRSTPTDEAAAAYRGRRGSRCDQQQAHWGPVLQAGAGEEGKWANGSGTSYADYGVGCPDKGATSSGGGHHLPEDQILRNLSAGHALVNLTEDGDCGARPGRNSPKAGTSLCSQGIVRGQQNEIPGESGARFQRQQGQRKRKGRWKRPQEQREGRPREERRRERRKVEVKKRGLQKDHPSHASGTAGDNYESGGQLGKLPHALGVSPDNTVQREDHPVYDSLLPDQNVFECLGQGFRPSLPMDGQSENSRISANAGFSRPSEKNEALRFDFEGISFSGLGSKALQYLLEVFPLRSQTLGGCDKGNLFPLPTSRSILEGFCPDLDSGGVSWLISVCIGLNSFWGGQLFNDEEATGVQSSCLKQLSTDVGRLCSLTERLGAFEWETFFKNRGVDYQGEEVKVAHYFTWENVAPALPKEIGRVALEDLCTLGAKHYVENFAQYLKPRELWTPVSKPRVMVEDSSWGAVCQGLVSSGVCTYLTKEELFQGPNGPLLNGMFGVTKDEFKDGVEVFRLIMNLIPLNTLCQSISGDIQTLPSWSLMNPFFLQPNEHLLISSEDVRCFFYVMAVPQSWWPFLGFNKRVPREVLPEHLKDEEVYLASRVLPMGFLNSVSLAQHVHRNLVLASSGTKGDLNLPQEELRKDRPISSTNPTWRVYLDNYDLLEKVEGTGAVCSLQGTAAPQVLALREQYEFWEVPRNSKKAAERQLVAEVQGACVDGSRGIAFPREQKLAKYVSATLVLVKQPRVSQRQMQVVCGGLVYVSMFRRQLLGTLNSVWKFISSFPPGGGLLPMPPECKVELVRFIALIPLARMDFRLPMHPLVTCSDASSGGGGICASSGLTVTGVLASQGKVRGDYPEARHEHKVLSIGLFDGIGALRVALDLVGANVLGHVSVESNGAASRVVESHFPGTIFVEDVALVDASMVREWACRYSQVSVVVLGGGPPCQGVSGLNSDRRGALKDLRSCLFVHVKRIEGLVRVEFPWCQVHSLMESVASMDEGDMHTMSQNFEALPYSCDAGSLLWCSRPRYYWITWDLWEQEGSTVSVPSEGSPGKIELVATQHLDQVTREGWMKVDPSRPYPTFTTSRPRSFPGRKPAGISQCSSDELARWAADLHRFPPYQYRTNNCLINRVGEVRLPSVAEREVMMGFPLDYTSFCLPKSLRKGQDYNDLRLTLIGNSWAVPVVAWLLQQLLSPMDLCQAASPQQLLDRLSLQGIDLLQNRLLRLPLRPLRGPSTKAGADALASKLGNLVSIKGEDVLLTHGSSDQVKFHRLRASIPSKLWKWKIIAGWRWCNRNEHINNLEMRAILTSLKWRICHQHHFKCRFIHLTDSLVCLHSLTRGRSSSRKLRRAISRINALLLASSSQGVWSYVHTDQNPADKPSRWGRNIKTKFRNA